MLGPQEPNGRQWKDDAAPRGRAPESLVLVLLAQNEYCVTLDSIAPAEALDLLRASVDEIAEDPASGSTWRLMTRGLTRGSGARNGRS